MHDDVEEWEECMGGAMDGELDDMFNLIVLSCGERADELRSRHVSLLSTS